MKANLTLEEMAELRVMRIQERGTPGYKTKVRNILATAKARQGIPPRKRRVLVEIDDVLSDNFGILRRKGKKPRGADHVRPYRGETFEVNRGATVYPPKYYVITADEAVAKLVALARASGTPVQPDGKSAGAECFGAKVVGDKLAVNLGKVWNTLTSNQVLQAFRLKGRELPLTAGAFCIFDNSSPNVQGFAGMRADDKNLYVPVS